MTKLYVGNLPYSTTNDDLSSMFSQYGPVTSASIIMDKYSGKSKGFGFVELEEDAKAEAAIAALNGNDMGGRNIVVAVARPMGERPQRSFGGGQNRFGGGGRDRNFRDRDSRSRRD